MRRLALLAVACAAALWVAGCATSEVPATGDAGRDRPEAAPAAGEDAGPKPCAPPSLAAGRNLTVTWGSAAVDFSGGTMSVAHDDGAHSTTFDLFSAGGEYSLQLLVIDGYSDGCPATVPFPTGANHVGLYLVRRAAQPVLIASSDEPSASGTLELNSLNLEPAAGGISFRCEGCVLPALATGEPSVSVQGTLREGGF